MNTIADRLELALKITGLTVAEVLRRGGPSRPTIYRIQNDPTYAPEAYTLERLAKALGVSLEWLAFEAGPMLSVADAAGETLIPYTSDTLDAPLLGECCEAVLELLERRGGPRLPAGKLGAAIAEVYLICQRDGRKPTDELVASFVRVLLA